MLGVFACGATIVPRLSLEEMVARSETIVSGQVTRIWTAWDSRHRFIWTHSEILVSNVTKGSRSERIVVSEPGGVVDGFGMQIAGTPGYMPGEQVMVFLERMPNGYLRTARHGSGKALPLARWQGTSDPRRGRSRRSRNDAPRNGFAEPRCRGRHTKSGAV